MPTIRLHQAASAEVHRAAGSEDPTDNERMRRVMGDRPHQGAGTAAGRPLKGAHIKAIALRLDL